MEESLESLTSQRQHRSKHHFSMGTGLTVIVVAYMGRLEEVQSFRFKEVTT